ncbi:MAG TPA: hypothetical protein VMG31_10805 [Verrucomicrobiae bacterium]|nr:hypothetical protein [Verrucomicrobiae bacterium]
MKRVAVVTAVLSLILTARPLYAQESSHTDEPKASATAAAKAKTLQSYRLDFTFSEIEDGKTLNTRRCSMTLTGGNSNEIKIGTRVPVAVASNASTASTQYQYMDVGMSIFSQTREHDGELELIVRGEISNIDTPIHTDSGSTITILQAPVVRQIKIEGSTLLVVGKPIVIGSVDDPNSKKEFQLQVTVSKL